MKMIKQNNDRTKVNQINKEKTVPFWGLEKPLTSLHPNLHSFAFFKTFGRQYVLWEILSKRVHGNNILPFFLPFFFPVTNSFEKSQICQQKSKQIKTKTQRNKRNNNNNKNKNGVFSFLFTILLKLMHFFFISSWNAN